MLLDLTILAVSCVSARPLGTVISVDESSDEKRRDRTGRGTGMEVGRYEVTWGCAAHKGSFAPVSPSGFIEPHRAWHGIPATLLYAMYQNAADPNYRGMHSPIFNVFIVTYFASFRSDFDTRRSNFVPPEIYYLFISQITGILWSKCRKNKE